MFVWIFLLLFYVVVITVTIMAIVQINRQHALEQSGKTKIGIKAKKIRRKEDSQQAATGAGEKDSDKIGSVEIIWEANKAAVSQFTSMSADMGLSLRECVSMLMGRGGPRNDLIMSDNRTSLSPTRKIWCETTPIYRDRKGGGIYVLFEKVDDDTCKKEALEFLGTIDAKCYAGGLCTAHGIDGKNVFV